MFPLKSGIGSLNTPDPQKVLYQSLTAAAMHEIGQQAIIDSSLLLFHQQAADIYFREENGIHMDTNDDGTYNLYTPTEREQLRKDIINVVIKFHIFDERGLAARLTPLINHLQKQEPVTYETMADPFIKTIFDNHRQYSSSLFNQNVCQTLDQIMNFNTVENLSSEEGTKLILNSYLEPGDMIDIAIFEDGVVQCACEFCEGFFQVQDKIQTIDRESLNFVQKSMMNSYNF